MTNWTPTLNIAQFRIARPTDKLAEVEQFYCEGLGLKKIGSVGNGNCVYSICGDFWVSFRLIL